MFRRPFHACPLSPASLLPRPAWYRPGDVLLSLVTILLFTGTAPVPVAAQEPLRIFISVDMEGIGGIGTGAMASSTGKDYATGRRLMTDEVNTVVAAILERGPAEILVNDSHGDMQNLLHTELDPRVTYIQGAIKPNGMMEGLDDTFHGVIFLGYHARAGTAEGFLAHTGSGAVKGLWINGLEAGEGEMNALYAGAMGVPVLLAAGDQVFVDQFLGNVPGAEGVVTKTAITPQSAHLLHPRWYGSAWPRERAGPWTGWRRGARAGASSPCRCGSRWRSASASRTSPAPRSCRRSRGCDRWTATRWSSPPRPWGRRTVSSASSSVPVVVRLVGPPSPSTGTRRPRSQYRMPLPRCSRLGSVSSVRRTPSFSRWRRATFSSRCFGRV
jgi:D-aminopeptidase